MIYIVVERVVSSAYIMNLNKLLEFAISFTYIIKSKGPSMDPWGTPVVTVNISDWTSSTSTYCFLFVR